MKYVDKLDATEVMLFARKYLVGNMRGQSDRTLEMFTEKHNAGWIVEHDFLGDSEYKEKEAFLFSDFAIAYLGGSPCQNEGRCEFMMRIQDTYTQFMIENFGDQYAHELSAERVKREARIAQAAERNAKRQIVQAKMDAYFAKDAAKAVENTQTQSDSAEAVRQ